MKIYTRTGDSGKTGLWGGTRVSKAHARIEAYGSLDELNAWVGALRDHDLAGPGAARRQTWYAAIQHHLFTLGSILAADPGKRSLNLPTLPPTAITDLERAIDLMESTLPPLRAFVLPGGKPVVSYAHIARTVCRRAERQMVYLSEQEVVDEQALTYINRLSDLFFVLGRALLHEGGGQDIEWHPGQSPTFDLPPSAAQTDVADE